MIDGGNNPADDADKIKEIIDKTVGPTGPSNQDATDYRQGSIGATGPAYIPSIEQSSTTEQIDYLRKSLEKAQSKAINRERKLSNKIVDLTAENARKDIRLNYYKDNRFNNNIVSLINIILTSIGASLVGADLKSTFGWILIVVGALLYILTIRDLIPPKREPSP